MANTAIATEVITVSTGSISFGNSLTMGTGSGTLSVTGAGTINFNGSAAPSFNFGGAATSPVFTTTAGCVLNFKNGFTNSSVALTLAYPSTTNFSGSGTISSAAAITFGDIAINPGDTLTLGGNISLKGNWTDNGTFIPGTNTVTFVATSPNIQTITKTGGETFYNLIATTVGTTLQLANNITVTNALTMSGENINLNGNTLQLGNGAAAALTRTAGIAYGGTWKRWIPVAAITSASGSNYGLFPIGTATDYRPVAINSTANPTTAGYIMATHTDALSITLVTYTDNAGNTIQDISDMSSTLTTSGLAGGTYGLTVSFTGFANTGVTTDLKLETHTGGTMGSVGTVGVTAGTVINPNVIRTALTATQLANVWVIGSKNIGTTPLRQFYYSRKSGNWDDVTAGNSTWSYTSGGAGTSCNCTPSSTSYVIINNGHTVTVDQNFSADYVDVNSGGTLNDKVGMALTVNKIFNLYGTGTFANTGNWVITQGLTLSSSSSTTASGSLTVNGKTTIPTGALHTQTAGTLNLSGDAAISGTLAIGSGSSNINGSNSVISGTGNITSNTGGTLTITNDKIISSGTNLTIGTSAKPVTVAISGTSNITNNGAVKIYGDLTGSVSGSTWTNAPNSSLQVTGAILATGTLSASASPDTVIYNGSGAQNIKTPSSGYYDLVLANAGTKSLTASTTIADAISIRDSATLDESTYALTGAGNLVMNGTGGLKLQRSTSGNYPELSGAYSLTGGTVTLNQTAGTATVANQAFYNLKLNGTQPYDISLVSNINNNLYIQNSSTITNNSALTVADSFIYASTGSSVLNDDLSAGSFTLSSGAIDDGGNTINVTGSGGWNYNGGTFTTTGLVNFNGTTAQQIKGSHATSFNYLAINNPTGVTLNLNPAAATVVTGSLSLGTGVLTTDNQNILKVANGATASSGSALSYVAGPMIKVGNDDFVFPIGKAGKWRRAAISGIVDSLTEITAEYFPSAYTNMLPVTGNLVKVSGVEYWTLSEAVSTDPLVLKFYWEGAATSTIHDCSKITIGHWLANQWIEEPATISAGSSCAGNGNGSLQTNSAVSTFGAFTFGGKTNNSLPIELISFDAIPVGNTVETNWSTALEINNAFFTIERSADGTNFEEIGKVDGAGNSSATINYSWTDDLPLQKVSYYRLRQTDFNGNTSVSNIKSVNFGVQSQIKLYPNPAHDKIFITISDPAEQVKVQLYDMQGREIYVTNFAGSNGNAKQTFTVPVSGVLPGMYMVAGWSGQNEFKEKLVIR